ncbi:hypothetical protein [Lyngbya sp. CCY1209]|uniref:hypothetical protein n=1 Tax=Lyngbya sp. CCY1209 TaxID=2886103 RepID=UPI002D215BD3|nr:hypothetical protein [Lyngbya sp. CCY1209]MEB3882096.1 hypothetical protein [Lyngbya sp. CCY1209]
MAKKISDRNTKAEILEAYQELQKEKSSLQSQLPKSAANGNGAATATQNVIKKPQKSNQSKLEATLASLTMFQSNFGGVIGEISEQLTSEASRLEELQNLVAESRQQLQDLHGIEEIEDDTLEVLIQQYEENSKTFEEELTDRRDALEQEWQERQAAWKKEQEEHQRAVRERNENYQKTRDRDEETYKYNLNLQREIDQEEYEQNKAELYKQLAEFKQERERQWAEREKAIAERETEHLEVTAKVAQFEKNLEDTVKKGKEMGRNIGNYQAKVKADLFAKEVEGQKQFYELRVKGLSETIQSQDLRIQNISKQLDAALKQVQDLAVKAIEGTSNSNSFQAMKEIALEQAKNQQKGK